MTICNSNSHQNYQLCPSFSLHRIRISYSYWHKRTENCMLHPFPTLLKNKLLRIFPSTFPEKKPATVAKWIKMVHNVFQPFWKLQTAASLYPSWSKLSPPEMTKLFMFRKSGSASYQQSGIEHWSHQVMTATWRDIYIYILLIIADLIRTWWQPLMMIPPCRVMFISISIINPSTTATEPPTKLKQNCKSTNLWRLEPLYTKSGTLVSSVQNPHNILSS